DSEIDVELTAFVKEIRKLLTTEIPKAPLSPDRVFTAKLPVTGEELYGRERELEILDNAWLDEKTRILTLVGWGGVGKSALVNHWLNRMDRDNYRGAARVYGWSFYSQGTSEDRQVSADDFFDYSLRWFGDPDPTQGAAWEKGVRLAGLLKNARTLLLLDGLEPLQYPPGEMHGHLKDQGLKALLRELARLNDGLCVVTT
ncbi:MAG: AAA family ATPase, partial [Desulfobacterales bacterium]|nr:AAA family ATPase [Desulfobacterales bacterium]